MATHRRHIFKHTDHKTIGFWFIYPAVILFSFHGLIVAYSNSTYLVKFVSPEAVGSLFTIAASLSVFAFLFISRVLRKIGNVRLIIWLSVLEIIALVGLGLAESIREAVVFFVLFAAINPLIYLSLDIFSESIIGSNEASTGSKRGLVLGFMSLAAVFAPLTTGYIVGTDDRSESVV